jgi:hypothetical protein
MEASEQACERASHHPMAESSGCFGDGFAKFPGAGLAWANLAEMAEAENTCRVAIRKLDLDSVIAYRTRGLGGHARLKHWQSGEGRSLGTRLRFLLALVIAHCARARISQIGKIVVARMIIRPGDINALACGKMDFQADRFFSGVEWNWHIDLIARSLVPQEICPVTSVPHF